MSEYSEDANDIKIKIIQDEVNKIRQKREIKEQLGEKIKEKVSNWEEMVSWTITLTMAFVTALGIGILILFFMIN